MAYITFKVDKIFGNINISINVTTKVVTFLSPIGEKSYFKFNKTKILITFIKYHILHLVHKLNK